MVVEIRFERSDWVRSRPDPLDYPEQVVSIRLAGELPSIDEDQTYKALILGKPSLSEGLIRLQHCDRDEENELAIQWVSQRGGWVMHRCRSWCEGAGLWDNSHSGPYAVNETCAGKILEAYGLSALDLSPASAPTTSPSELTELGEPGRQDLIGRLRSISTGLYDDGSCAFDDYSFTHNDERLTIVHESSDGDYALERKNTDTISSPMTEEKFKTFLNSLLFSGDAQLHLRSVEVKKESHYGHDGDSSDPPILINTYQNGTLHVTLSGDTIKIEESYGPEKGSSNP